MSKPFDAALKELIEKHPADWLALVGAPVGAALQVIDSDVSTVSAAADKIIQIDAPVPSLLHLELESSSSSDPGEHLQWYNTLIRHRHSLPVQSVVILLRPAADSPRWDGLFQHRWLDGTVYLEFRYRVVRLWELPVNPFLNGGLGILPLVTLADVPETELPQVLEQVAQRLNREAAPSERHTLWQTTFVLTGLRLPQAAILALFQGVTTMGNILEDSSAYQVFKDCGLRDGRNEGLREGRNEGLREGHREGLCEGLCEVILELGQSRLGAPGQDARATLKQIPDPERLKRMIQQLQQVSSWDELLATP